MTARVCPDPRCAELNPPDAVICQVCHTALVPGVLRRPTAAEVAAEIRMANARIGAAHMQAVNARPAL